MCVLLLDFIQASQKCPGFQEQGIEQSLINIKICICGAPPTFQILPVGGVRFWHIYLPHLHLKKKKIVNINTNIR